MSVPFDSPCPCCRYYTITNPRCHEQCPICGWLDKSAYNDVDAVWIDQAQQNFRATGACSRSWLDSVSAPSPGLRRASSPHTIDEWKRGLAAQFVDRARNVFGQARRPRRFTSHHCDECIEHDRTMQNFDNDTLSMTPLENPGWDPLGFLTPEGFRYFMPGLIRVQIEALQSSAAEANGWRYLGLLDFHLCDAEGERFSLFAADEIQLVADVYQAVLRCPGLDVFLDVSSKIERAALSWLARAAKRL